MHPLFIGSISMKIKALKLIDCGCATAIYEEVFATVHEETETEYKTNLGVFKKCSDVVIVDNAPILSI